MPSIKGNIPRIDKRNETYYAVWYEQSTKTTKRISLRTKNASEARIGITNLIKDKTGYNPVTVRSILEKYQKDSDHVIDYKRLQTAVRRLCDFMGDLLIYDVDVPLCEEYGRKRGVEPSTVARELSVLKAAANHAVKWKTIDKTQLPVIDMPRTLPKREGWLFRDEIEHLKDNATPIMKAFLRILYYTGSRRKAIETLTWDQVDFERGTISLNPENGTITKKRRPTVPMGDLRELLMNLHKIRRNEWVLGSNKNRSYDFRKLTDKAGLTVLPKRNGRPECKCIPHLIRHSRATHLLEKGTNIYTVAKLLGDTVATVERVYGHVSMDKMADELAE